jgi:hypothetical protein
MNRSATLACLFLVVLVPLTAGPAGAIDAKGTPDLDLTLPDDTITPGQETELDFQLVNQGGVSGGGTTSPGIVTDARSVVVEASGETAPFTIKTKRQSVGVVTTNDPTEVPVDITVPQDASPGTYEVEVEVEYMYTSSIYIEEGLEAQSDQPGFDRFEIDVTITDDAQFQVAEVDSNLRVGEEGRITGQLENTGGSVARNTEIEFTPSNENINALSSSVAVGDIPADGSAPFSIPVEVTSNAEAVPHRFDLNVNYRDENGISQNTDDPEFLVDIAEQRDAFRVEPVNRSITAGGSRPLDLRVTNNLDEPVTDIEGKFFADDPLDSTNDETFTGSLDPGETTTVTVDLSASGGATIKNYPASVDFRYVDSEGDSKLTDSYRMAISVTEPEESGGSPVGLIVGLLVVLAGGGFLAWRRGLFERFTG